MNVTSTVIASVVLLFGVGQAEESYQEWQETEVAVVDGDCEELVETDELAENCEDFTSVEEELAAQEQDDAIDEIVLEDEEHVIVDSRPLLPQTQHQMEQARQAELEQSTELTEEEAIQLGVLIIPIKSQNLLALASNQIQSTAATLSPCHYHTISSFPQGNVIKIDDGSEWVFDRADSQILRTWKAGHQIIITPNQHLLSGSHYTYVITNTELGDSVNVNLFLGPVAFGHQTSWVVGIDQNSGKIYIINGRGERTVWEVSSSDMYLIKDWKVNDTVIIGENDSWLWAFSSYKSMMINVNMNHYIRAQQIFQTNQKW
ncbi:MAG: hypothetical protein JSS30_07320 [Verrucomicrobia bacterium]|nr:hypothetical protein [Verrucomicrobiota bacterium]